jgi:hypothetical protein
MPEMVDAVFERRLKADGTPDLRSGRLVIAKPAGWFDAHPQGEGNPNLFVIIRCTREQLAQYVFDEDREVEVERWNYEWVGEDGKPKVIPEDLVRFRGGKMLYEEPTLWGGVKISEIPPDAVSRVTKEMASQKVYRNKLDLAELERRRKTAKIAHPTLQNVYSADALCVMPTTAQEQSEVARDV